VIGLVLYPYVYLSARAMFQLQSAEFFEAAQTLGANRWTVFWRVSLPMARPALAVGVALVALETLNDSGASEYLGVRTLTVSIFTTWLNRGSLAGAAQLSCFMLATVGGLIALERYGRRNAATEFSAESPRLRPRTALAGAKAGAVFAACLVPVLLGFVVPLLYLVQQSFKRGLLANFDMSLWRDAFNSVAFASLATLTALLLAFATILAWRWRPNALRTAAMNVSQTGYALPGLVLALGLLTPVLAVDHGLNALAGWAGWSLPGLVMIGSGAAVGALPASGAMSSGAAGINTGLSPIFFPRTADVPAAASASASCVGAVLLVRITMASCAVVRQAYDSAAGEECRGSADR